ncbi:phosphotransferase [Serratia ureilytica]|uniref:phosphotransferase n=1 Tax=Serratia ureilytica TaxID=300181 RepID=UPI0018D7E345|nr:phosphotransferase [Serratia ureilytica]MBH3321840.1 phosphotransferase [Serratia ureilytica]
MELEMQTGSTLNSDEVHRIESLYGLTVKSSAFLGMGSGNTNYCLETDIGRCVFSIIEEQSRDDVEIMAKTLVWLEAHDYETSLLVKPKGQESYSIILRGKHSLLRTYMDGAVRRDFNEHMLRQLGVAMAKLHTIPVPNFLTDSVFYEQKKFMDALDANIDQDYERWAKDRLRHLAVERISGLPTSVIHSDLFYDNMLFEGEQFVGMIDFELTCIYHSVFDIAMAIVGTCGINGRLSPEKAKHIIAGYNSIRMLEAREIKVLKTYTEYAAILTSLWRYWRYRIYQPGGDKSDKYREMTSLAKSIERTDFSQIC